MNNPTIFILQVMALGQQHVTSDLVLAQVFFVGVSYKPEAIGPDYCSFDVVSTGGSVIQATYESTEEAHNRREALIKAIDAYWLSADKEKKT